MAPFFENFLEIAWAPKLITWQMTFSFPIRPCPEEKQPQI